MTTKIFDLRIREDDEPENDQHIVGNSSSIYPHISNQLANFLESVSAALMQYGCTLQQYNGIIEAFKEVGKVKEKNHLLYWID